MQLDTFQYLPTWAFFLLVSRAFCTISESRTLPELHRIKRQAFPPQCGISKMIRPLILGGQEASVGTFPWHAGLYYRLTSNGTESWNTLCGGSLISDQFVLTAAHCVFNKDEVHKVENVRVTVGKYFRVWDTNEDSQQKRNVSKIIYPYDFYKPILSFDIALVMLDRKIEIGEHAMPVCTGISYQPSSTNNDNQQLTVAGWGLTESKVPSNKLLYTNAMFLSQNDCRRRIPVYYSLFDKFCTNRKNESVSFAQPGDSGGGLTVLHEERHFIVGIVSSEYNQVTLFTNLSWPNHITWIESEIRKYDSSYTWTKSEITESCQTNSQCPEDRACHYQHCVDPCEEADCGKNTLCKVRKHFPICACKLGFVGDAFHECTPYSNSCQTNSHCPENRACRQEKCVDPCEEAVCGNNTVCNVKKHFPICACRFGFVGDAFHECVPNYSTSLEILLAINTKLVLFDHALRKQTALLNYLHLYNGDYVPNWPSVDYHYSKRFIFYTFNNRIYRDEIAGHLKRTGPPKVIVTTRVEGPVRLAVDYVHDKLYWRSHRHQTVEMANLDGSNRTLLTLAMTNGVHESNIAIDPYAGYLFMVANYTIFRAGLDGSNLKHLRLEVDDGREVNNIALDTQKRRIYYIYNMGTTNSPYISSCDYECTNGQDLFLAEDSLTDIYTIDVFRDTLYLGVYENTTVSSMLWSVDLTNPELNATLLKTLDEDFWTLKVYHPGVQLPSL